MIVNQPQRQTSTLATMAMVFAVLGIIGGCCTFGVFSIVSIVLGHLAWKETHSGEKGGHGMTVASLVISYIVLIPAIFFTISFGITAATGGAS